MIESSKLVWPAPKETIDIVICWLLANAKTELYLSFYLNHLSDLVAMYLSLSLLQRLLSQHPHLPSQDKPTYSSNSYFLAHFLAPVRRAYRLLRFRSVTRAAIRCVPNVDSWLIKPSHLNWKASSCSGTTSPKVYFIWVPLLFGFTTERCRVRVWCASCCPGSRSMLDWEIG